MTKRLIIILISLLLLLSLLPGGEARGSLHFSSGLFTSSYGATLEKGMFRASLSVDSAFPNLFLISTFQNPSEVLDNLLGSLTIFYGGGITLGLDIIPSEKHDLILGTEASAVYTEVFNYSLLLSSLSAKVKYQYKTRGGT
ncbi:MAG: hypothetical protein ACI4S4_00890, partial [Candidatus Ornithospirochaeta sp.]